VWGFEEGLVRPATRLTPDVIKHRQPAPGNPAAKTNTARGAQLKRGVVINPEGGNQRDRKKWPEGLAITAMIL
jgi:hypothetical protein